MSTIGVHDDWLSLIEISGPFLAVPVLKEAFPQGLEELDATKRKRLRQAYEEWREALEQDDAQFAELHVAWIDEVLSRGLELNEDGKGDVLKRADWCAAKLQATLPEHGVKLSPDLAVVDEQRANKPLLLIQTYSHDIDLDATLKQDGWAAKPADRMVALCRSLGCRLGLVTNGERWMLVDAPVGAVTTFASWYARIWSQEPISFQAFVHLLGIRRFFVDETEQLPALFDRSLKFQDEVTDALGEQVRRAVEVLIQTLDKADQDRNRELLHDVKEAELYEAALTVMMRLVFLLSAEERGLLLMGDERYEANYALSTLRAQLRTESEGILERRWDAWSRLLALFRVVFGGIEHENLRLPALGGSLFDPDRFPFLEGRAKNSNWTTDIAKPLPIDNRTVLLLLEAIQQFRGRTLSYRALDVEQIGYVYEGLLERTVKRTEEITLELDGAKDAKSPWIKLVELESRRLDGASHIVDLLHERMGSSTSRIRNDLAKSVDDNMLDRLLTACQGDIKLRDRVKPYTHLLRADPWGYPLVYPAGAFIVTAGSDRRETGTHYTPKSLTEAIVAETLIPVAYVGPAEDLPRNQWILKSPAELLDLKICDPAMGSGAFLVQACRWLSDRLVEAWSRAEASGKNVSVDGEILGEANEMEPLPLGSEARTVIARRLVAERCLYGVDLNPLAVELAKLSIWLVTMAKDRPFGFLDHNLRCGDSLLGIHRLDQLTELSMIPTGKGQQRLFGQNIERAVLMAIELRRRLREIPIRDIHDIEAMGRLDTDARRKLDVPERIADAFIGSIFAARGNASTVEKANASLAIEAEPALDGNGDAVTSVIFRASTLIDQVGRQPFHWPLEFPEVFAREHGGFNGILGNPPFLGGRRISSVNGHPYSDWLITLHESSVKNADLSSHFFRRAFNLLAANGHMGLLATKTIAEGDTRQSGLEWLVKNGAAIHAAYPSETWPGSAAVVTSRVHLCKGKWQGARRLSGKLVPNISAFLSTGEEWSLRQLKANGNKAFEGSKLNAIGFVIGVDDAQRMLDEDPRNADVVFPYLNGEDLNSDPEQRPSRYVINFWDWPEEKARLFAAPWKWIEEHVYPKRVEQSKEISYKSIMANWWQHWRVRSELYHAVGYGRHFARHPEGWDHRVQPLQKIMAVTRVSKTLAFSFVPAGTIFSDATVAFAADSAHDFALLQSTIHGIFAWQYSSRLKNDLRYSPTDALEPFPFPEAASDILDTLGIQFHAMRCDYMSSNRIGLTKLYNRFHDPVIVDSGIRELRDFHRRIDGEVMQAYGWEDLDLEHGFHEVPYLPENDRRRYTICETARIEVLRRLSELNRKYYAEEVARNLHETRKKTRVGGSSSSKSNTSAPQYSMDFGEESNALSHSEASDTARLIGEYLRNNFGWHSKSAILAATGTSDEQWNVTIKSLIKLGDIERQGERRGAEYRAKV